MSGFERLGEIIARMTVEPTEDQAEAKPEPTIACTTCQDMRWLRLIPQVGHAEFGSARRCPDCLDQDRAYRLGQMATTAGLSEAQRRQTFDRLVPVRGMAPAVKAAGAWAKHPDGWLVIHGHRGSGKTHLSCAVANALISAERACLWWHVPDLINQARRASVEQRLHLLDGELRATPILILDSLAAARGTEFVLQDLLEPLLDARYRDRRPTMLTTIGTPQQIAAEWSADIGSRMGDRAFCTVVHNSAPSFRERATEGATA